MAEEVEMIPVAGAEPPKANPLGAAIHKPAVGAAAAKPALTLPPKAPAATLKPGLKLPTQTALKPGLKLPARPVIRRPGATVAAAPIPKPVSPAAAVKPVESEKPMDALKQVTQKLKGVTQEIPQQAILRKTGIIAEGAMSDAQKEAAKHKTARISLADAMGVAPVKEEPAPMKTIRIKRPVNVPGATASLKPQPAASPAAAPAAPAATAPTATSATLRKTLKISRPGVSSVHPTGKFGIKRPEAPAPASAAPAAGEAVADIPELPTVAPLPAPAVADEGAAWPWTLSAIVQLAACLAMGALAWFLYENSQTLFF